MSMKCPACGKNHWDHCTDKSVPLWKRMIAGEYDDGDRYLSESRKAVSARIFAREVNRLEKKAATRSAENARLRKALEQVEWSSFVLDDEGCVISYICPLCDQVKEKGHSPDCLVGAALGRQV